MAVVERLAHFLTGWVEFEVRGNGPRFFNTAAKAGVEFWGFSRRGERLSARGTPGDYKRLRELARRLLVEFAGLREFQKVTAYADPNPDRVL